MRINEVKDLIKRLKHFRELLLAMMEVVEAAFHDVGIQFSESRVCSLLNPSDSFKTRVDLVSVNL